MSFDAIAKHCFAYNGSLVSVVNEDTIAYSCGNTIQFYDTVSKTQSCIVRAASRSLGAFDCCARTSFVAVAVIEPQAELQLYSYPDKKLRGKLSLSSPKDDKQGARKAISQKSQSTDIDETINEYELLKFSRCGSRILSVSKTTPLGQDPVRKLCVWDVKSQHLLYGCASKTLQLGRIAFASFDPENLDRILIGGEDGLQVWKLYNAQDPISVLRSVQVKPWDKNARENAWVCHAWLPTGQALVSNQIGNVYLLGVSTGQLVKPLENARHPDEKVITAMSTTSESVVVAYDDGLVQWFEVEGNSLDLEIVHSVSMVSVTGTENEMSIKCMLFSPSYAHLYASTPDTILKMKSSIPEVKEAEVEQEAEDASVVLAEDTSSTTPPKQSDAVLPDEPEEVKLETEEEAQEEDTFIQKLAVSPRNEIFATSTITPCGGVFGEDTYVVSGGIDGQLFAWNLRYGKGIEPYPLADIFSKSVLMESDPEEIEEVEKQVIVTSISSVSADPILGVGDHTGRLRIVCVAKQANDAQPLEVLPLHSVQLYDYGHPLDVLEVHPNQPLLLAASTQTATVYIISLEHEIRFPVLAFYRLKVNDEAIVDAKWSISALNRSSTVFTVLSSSGEHHFVRYVPDQTEYISESDDLQTVELVATSVVSNAVTNIGFTSLQFLPNAPVSVMLMSSIDSTELVALKYNDGKSGDVPSLSSKVLAPTAHEGGINCLAVFPRPFANNVELVSTAGVDGVITFWLITFLSSVAFDSDAPTWKLEDVQITKKKSIAMHTGPIIAMQFIFLESEAYLVTIGSDKSSFALELRIDLSASSEFDTTPTSINPLYVSIEEVAKFQHVYDPEQEAETTPFMDIYNAHVESKAHSRTDKDKDKTRAALAELAESMKQLLSRNEDLPEDEQLSREEFVLNMEWKDTAVQANGEKAEAYRVELNRAISKQSIIRERMKREFWDDMKEHGIKLRGLSPSSTAFVYNFPIRTKKQDMEKKAKQIQLLRIIEHEHQRQESAMGSSNSPSTRFSSTISSELQWMVDAGKDHPSIVLTRTNLSPSDESQVPEKSVESLEPEDIVYHPALLHSRKQRRIQIELLHNYIHKLWLAYNDKFKKISQLKRTKMDEIESKNKRIAEIRAELATTDSATEANPTWATDEIAASILEVTEDEMVERPYETLAMRRRREKEEAEKAELEASRRKDDAPTRALNDMMNGTLEVTKESLATATLEKETWMIETPEEELTPDQKLLIAEFEAKQQKLAEEQDKYRKALDQELKKLQAEIEDIIHAFDHELVGMQSTYLDVRRDTIVQQLYMARLQSDLLSFEITQNKRSGGNEKLPLLEQILNHTDDAIDWFTSHAEALKDEWQRAVENEKHCERTFMRELEEATGGVSLDADLAKQVYELYKKRDKDSLDENQKPGSRAKRTQANDRSNNGSLVATQRGSQKELLLSTKSIGSDRPSLDPFHHVDHIRAPVPVHERVFASLDYDHDRPEGLIVDDRMWRALDVLRTKRLRAEAMAKEKANQVLKARSIVEELQGQREKFALAREQHLVEQDEQARRLEFVMENAPVLVHLKQGQDEAAVNPIVLASGDPNDSTDLMVARSSVEKLNAVLQEHGREQVGILTKIKDFRKNINLMQWEHALLDMQITDADELYTDLQLLRVTKDLQELFRTGDTSYKQQREINLLHSKLEHVAKHHQKKLVKIESGTQQLRRQVVERQRENNGFEEQVRQLETDVQIREDILASRQRKSCRDLGEPTDERLKAITIRRKLMDLARAQTDEIEYLRAELDRMRRRTFPSFVQYQAETLYHPPDMAP